VAFGAGEVRRVYDPVHGWVIMSEGEATPKNSHSNASRDHWIGTATLVDLGLNALGRFDGVRVGSLGDMWTRATCPNMPLIAGQENFLTVYYLAGTSGRCRVQLDLNGLNVSARGPVGALVADNQINGTLTDVVNYDLGGGIYCMTCKVVSNASVNVTIGIGPDTATVGLDVIALGGQMTDVASSFIFTDGALDVRPADDLSFNIAALDLAGGYSVVFEGVITGRMGDFDRVFHLGDNDYRQSAVYAAAAGNIVSYAYHSGDNQGSATNAYTLGDDLAVGFAIGQDHCQHDFNGAPSFVDDEVDFQAPSIGHLFSSGGGNYASGLLKGFAIYPEVIAGTELG
jgi:hypothetical protein